MPSDETEITATLDEDRLSASAFLIRRPGNRFSDAEWDKLCIILTHLLGIFGNLLGVEIISQPRGGYPASCVQRRFIRLPSALT